MVATTSEVFEFLKEHQPCSLVRYEIFSHNFSILRQKLRMIIKNLYEGDASAMDISNALRIRLSEWLTVPVPFDNETLVSLSILGEPVAVANRWGRDIGAAYEACIKAATILSHNENPMRSQVRSTIEDLRAKNKMFKIYCHRSARPHYESIMNEPVHEPIGETCFINTSKGYREVQLFDALIKVGPLRSRGWGWAPDALLTAPRFETLLLLVWSGCGDEQGFGLDPVTGSAIIEGAALSPLKSAKDQTSHTISWEITAKRTGDNQIGYEALPADEDEFQIFQTMADSHDNRAAVLIQIDEEHGILFPKRGQILSFDPAANERDQIERRLPGETLIPGMVVVFPLLEDVDLGGLHAQHGKLSPIWKKRLSTEVEKDQDDLCKKLSDGGIELLSLRSRLKDWCKPPTTVIPAPQKASHFKVLIDVLNIDIEQHSEDKTQTKWWQYAWREIRRSRGEAIQEGRLGQEIVEEQIVEILDGLREQIAKKCESEDDFTIAIPAGKGLHGDFRFCKVTSVEDGFHAPEIALRNICDLREFEQWRV